MAKNKLMSIAGLIGLANIVAGIVIGMAIFNGVLPIPLVTQTIVSQIVGGLVVVGGVLEGLRKLGIKM